MQLMNGKRKTALAIVLAATLAGSAQADGWRGHPHHGWPQRGPVYVQRADWLAPLVVLGIAGAAISAAAQAPARVVVPPPVPVYQAAPVYMAPVGPAYAVPPQAVAPLPYGVAYYCPDYGQYHPQVQSCPGGWQLVDVAR